MRSKGTCVDLCSIHHEVRPGVKGTQCIWSHGPRQSLKVNLTNLGGTMGVKMYPILLEDTTTYPVHEITSSPEWQPQRHQNCTEPSPNRPYNKELAQETINNTFVLEWQKITANASNIDANPELIDSGATQSIIHTQNATNILHTIDDDTDSSIVAGERDDCNLASENT